MNSSKRLKFLSSLYKSESNIWDIGCDHGHLGLSFSSNPKVEAIHLIDPSKEVIKRLRIRILDSDIPKRENIFIHQERGESIKVNHSKNLFYIAGMGGRNIVEILQNLGPQIESDSRVIISPHNHILETRDFLSRSKFKLEGEYILEENSKYYQILELNLNPTFPNVSPFGEKMWKSEEAQRYKNHLLQYLPRHQDEKSKEYVQFLNQI